MFSVYGHRRLTFIYLNVVVQTSDPYIQKKILGKFHFKENEPLVIK